ncbi:hypothetical protein T4E_3167 [Trichinella pseudospiralis]|uniref:Uncharacterized protein n=1 Tax=Trichinella pseudospiralis TaxID=6337 RepID=A0A0V0YFX3_TRIPS|nr:hypothetical protein T4E_3167 [Trichinella pseudospiralis]
MCTVEENEQVPKKKWKNVSVVQLTESKQRILRELVDGGEPGLETQISQVEFDDRLEHFASDVSFICQQTCLQDGCRGE